jgi:uncharacterized delta-60 repeat protein
MEIPTMQVTSWLGSLAARLKPARQRQRRPRASFRPQVEGLEDRLTPSGGLLDPTFGSGGIVNLPTATDNVANGVAVQPDGKVVIAGQIPRGGGTEISVQRLNRDGSLDTTFNKTGSVTIQADNSDHPNAVALQPDGKILVGGGATARNGAGEYLVARLTPNGTLDATFGSKGLWLSPGGQVYNLAVLTDAAHTTVTGIVASAGSPPGTVAVKLTPAGAPDKTFGSGGFAAFPGLNGSNFQGLAVSPAGEIYLTGHVYVGGSSTFVGCLVALTPGGVPDSTFGGGTGYVLSPVGSNGSEFDAVAVQTVTVGGQSVSRVVVAGWESDIGSPNVYVFVAGYTLGGSLDTTFGSGGLFTTATTDNPPPLVRSLALEADGSIVVGWTENYTAADGTTHSEMLVGHLTAAGAADASFGSGGTGFAVVQDGLDSQLRGLAIDPTGNILACGESYATSGALPQAAVVRLTAP